MNNAGHNKTAIANAKNKPEESPVTSIFFKETDGIHRPNEPFTIGIPFAAGQCSTTTLFSLWDNNQQLTLSTEPTLYWPDGSIRWLLISSRVTMAAHSEKRLQLRLSDPVAVVQQNPIQSKQTAESLIIETAEYHYQFDQHGITIKRLNANEPPLKLLPELNDAKECTLPLRLKSWQFLRTDNIKTTLQAQGEFLHPEQNTTAAHLKFTITLYHADGLMQLKTTLHNPKPAIHRGGLWDLGDPASLHFKRFSLAMSAPTLQQTAIIPDCLSTQAAYFAQPSLCLHQDSSGGDNWQSPNHINKDGVITTQFQGYKLIADTTLLTTGLRANPLLKSQYGATQLQVSVPEFWQNFPNALLASQTQVRCDLFAQLGNGLNHELQGGERKTRTVWLSLTNLAESLAWSYAPLVAKFDTNYLVQSEAMPWLSTQTQDPLAALIQQGLDGENSFFQKREKIDEYGWRNFGDIFADHETLYQKAEEPRYISHYNNQYDAVYGFARQFLISGDQRWFRLMDELARHVTDIDIYHTTEDRHEYNNGLFWHTDHYVDAHTATHRTYSSKNDPTGNGQIGGGPGPEHCYSTGLLYHYLLTGNEDSKTAVLELAQWMVYSHEGAGGLLEQLFFIKELELPKLKALMRGETLACNTYPFTRGTANYINALLDAHKLKPNQGWLIKAEQVIKATFHPADPIYARNLLNAETGWHYLVLLSSLVSFLRVKAEYQQFDDAYHYTLQCFQHYSRWMLDNEQPFLEHAEQLEYPNHTWVAQDLRKAMLFFIATTLDPAHAQAYKQKAEFFLNYVIKTLNTSPERQLARLQIIMLLVHGPHLCHTLNAKLFNEQDLIQPNNALKVLTRMKITRKILKRLIKGLINLRLSRELAWLRYRLKG